MPLQEGRASVEVPDLLGYGNVARVVKDGTADNSKTRSFTRAGFSLSTRRRLPGPTGTIPRPHDEAGSGNPEFHPLPGNSRSLLVQRLGS